MIQKEKFHRAFLKYGGIANLQPENHLYNVILLAAHDIIVTKIKHQKNLPLPTIRFINGSTLNASAANYENEYFIGVNWGTLGILQNISLRMLSSKNTFPWIGNPSNEGEAKKIYTHQHRDYELIKWRKGDEEIKPKHKIRNIASYVMLEYMVKFILAHEYTHIINGHVDFINSLSETSEILDETKHTKLNPLQKQTLEMDADCIAANIFFRDWVHGSSFIGLSKLISEKFANEQLEIFANEEFDLKLFIASMLIFFRIMEPHNMSSESLKSSTHPTAYLRSHFVFETVRPYLLSKSRLDLLGMLNRSFPEVQKDVISAFNDITDGPVLPFRDGKLSTEEQVHVDSLLKEWKDIRLQIKPFAIHDLLAS